MSQYSPLENMKFHEKPVAQNTNGSLELETIINDLINTKSEVNKDCERKQLVQNYLEFKQLIEKDVDDPDISLDRQHKIEECVSTKESNLKTKSQRSAPYRRHQDKHKSLKCKKNAGKKRRRKSEEETEAESLSSSDDISDA